MVVGIGDGGGCGWWLVIIVVVTLSREGSDSYANFLSVLLWLTVIHELRLVCVCVALTDRNTGNA